MVSPSAKSTECSWVQDVSVTLCEERVMVWEVFGIGSEIIRLFVEFIVIGILHRVILL